MTVTVIDKLAPKNDAFTGLVDDDQVIFSDITDGDASAAKHGYLPKLSDDDADFLNGKGAWAVPASGGGGLTWEIITANQIAEVNHGYITNKDTLLTLLLPATAAVNDIVRVSGMGAGGWTITQGAGQQVHFGNKDTTSGAGGSLASVHIRDAAELICCVADVEFNVISSVGNITIV